MTEGVTPGVTPSFDVRPAQLRQTGRLTGSNSSCELWDGGACPHRRYVVHAADAHGSVMLAGSTVHSKTHTGAAQAVYALREATGGC